jgi:hypothetical protein
VIKSNGYWKQDKNGEEIIRGLTLKASAIYKGDLVNDSIDILLIKNAKMKDLFDNKMIIMDYANDDITLKNNVKHLMCDKNNANHLMRNKKTKNNTKHLMCNKKTKNNTKHLMCNKKTKNNTKHLMRNKKTTKK